MRSFPGKVLLAAALLCAGFACDDEPQPPPELLEQARKTDDEDGPKRPTTQELLQGPRGVISLGPLPLTVRAPKDWKVESVGTSNIILLRGPTPGGEAQVALSRRPSAAPERVEAVINGAKKEMATTQSSVKMAEVRPLGGGGARVFERQEVGRMMPAEPLDAEGKVMSKPSAALSWTITVFVPQGEEVEAYELNFLGLTVDQYETDKQLLRQIIDSLALAGAAPPPSPA
jgi:hypothetical protein